MSFKKNNIRPLKALKKHKIFLLENDLSVPDMARELKTDKRPYESTRVMIWQMLGGTNYYPHLASELQEKYGIVISRPKSKRKYSAKQAA
jgi:hypothetical protein